MQGPHRTILTYFYGETAGERGSLEVGEVTCVPPRGDDVYIQNVRYRVKSVAWSPDTTGKPITWVAVTLRSPPTRAKKRPHSRS